MVLNDNIDVLLGNGFTSCVQCVETDNITTENVFLAVYTTTTDVIANAIQPNKAVVPKLLWVGTHL